jgi:DNA-binding winged helix-turn-helix (wHTH) protein
LAPALRHPHDHAYRFGQFELNPATRQCLPTASRWRSRPRRSDVLLALVERSDRMVSKDELLGLAWPGVVVEENNLQVQISALRKVLGPDAIATIAGRGYRFALALEKLELLEPITEPAAQDAASDGYLRDFYSERIVRTVLVVDVVESVRLIEANEEQAVARWRGADGSHRARSAAFSRRSAGRSASGGRHAARLPASCPRAMKAAFDIQHACHESNLKAFRRIARCCCAWARRSAS